MLGECAVWEAKQKDAPGSMPYSLSEVQNRNDRKQGTNRKMEILRRNSFKGQIE
jgi:hypothetical protein